jgi:flagellar M-ring protein FliF
MIQWWRGLVRNQKIGFTLAAIVVAVFVIAAGYWVLKSDFVPLFEGTAPEDSASLVTGLEALGAPYKVDSKSGTVLVPPERRDELRAKLMQQGAGPKNPVGFELFNNSDFGMTEFAQRINYERGLEGELTRTIMSLEGVRYARVHLVLPDSTLFKKDEDQAKASVTLMTRMDHQLPEAQIEGIRKLVAAAVPGLKPDTVSIHDYRGVDLASGDAASGAADPVSGRVRDEELVETRLAAKVYDILRAIFPPGSVAVSVDVRLRMDKVSSTRQDTSLEAPKSTELSQLRNELSGSPADQSVGTAKPDVPGNLAALAVHADAIVHRGSQYSEQVEKTPGAIEQLSVGVLVPNALPSDMSLEQLQQVVSTAVGADPQRNDHVAVYAVATLNSGHTDIGGKASNSGVVGKLGSSPINVDADGLSDPLRLGAAVLGVLAFFAMAFAIGRSSHNESRLTKEERERLIADIRLGLKDVAAGKEERTA